MQVANDLSPGSQDAEFRQEKDLKTKRAGKKADPSLLHIEKATMLWFGLFKDTGKPMSEHLQQCGTVYHLLL